MRIKIPLYQSTFARRDERNLDNLEVRDGILGRFVGGTFDGFARLPGRRDGPVRVRRTGPGVYRVLYTAYGREA